MTDKQKELLNEMTEVSQECGLYECSYKGECHQMGCLDDKDCFLRQLFEERDSAERTLYRKEQECERLNKDNAILFDKAIEARKENTTLQVQLYQLKVENEELKQAHYLAKEILKTLGVLDE